MAKGISLHLGLNAVDPAHYDGWDGAVSSCEYDAKDMAAIANKQGFAATTLLLTKQATVAAVSQAIRNAASNLPKATSFS